MYNKRLMKKILSFNFSKIFYRKTHNIEFVELLNDFSKHNIQYIKRMEIIITNPKEIGFLYPNIFEANLIFNKDDMLLTKTFKNNNIKNIFDQINDFINKEIKF